MWSVHCVEVHCVECALCGVCIMWSVHYVECALCGVSISDVYIHTLHFSEHTPHNTDMILLDQWCHTHTHTHAHNSHAIHTQIANVACQIVSSVMCARYACGHYMCR